jgi:hypothetical protein
MAGESSYIHGICSRGSPGPAMSRAAAARGAGPPRDGGDHGGGVVDGVGRQAGGVAHTSSECLSGSALTGWPDHVRGVKANPIRA